MKIYLTRHGQVLPEKYFGSVDCPDGDIPLSDLGKEQAEALGKKLSELNFKGVILSSPYLRTMTTADIAASVCGAKIYPETTLREAVFDEEEMLQFKGMDLPTLQQRFSNIAPDATLVFPWWTTALDITKVSASERIDPFLDRLLGSGQQEVLLVGHGASTGAVQRYFQSKFGYEIPAGVHNVNCNLSWFELDEEGDLIRAVLYYNEHLSDPLMTSNAASKERFSPVVIERKK